MVYRRGRGNMSQVALRVTNPKQALKWTWTQNKYISEQRKYKYFTS